MRMTNMVVTVMAMVDTEKKNRHLNHLNLWQIPKICQALPWNLLENDYRRGKHCNLLLSWAYKLMIKLLIMTYIWYIQSNCRNGHLLITVTFVLSLCIVVLKPKVLIQITFTLSSNFKAFLFTDVDDFDMMH
jgi:hypothetical protein